MHDYLYKDPFVSLCLLFRVKFEFRFRFWVIAKTCVWSSLIVTKFLSITFLNIYLISNCYPESKRWQTVIVYHFNENLIFSNHRCRPNSHVSQQTIYRRFFYLYVVFAQSKVIKNFNIKKTFFPAISPSLP